MFHPFPYIFCRVRPVLLQQHGGPGEPGLLEVQRPLPALRRSVEFRLSRLRLLEGSDALLPGGEPGLQDRGLLGLLPQRLLPERHEQHLRRVQRDLRGLHSAGRQPELHGLQREQRDEQLPAGNRRGHPRRRVHGPVLSRLLLEHDLEAVLDVQPAVPYLHGALHEQLPLVLQRALPRPNREHLQPDLLRRERHLRPWSTRQPLLVLLPR